MTTTTHADVLDGICGAIEAVVDGLDRAKKMLDPATDPATRLHKAFSVDLQTDNTGKFRDARQRAMRLVAETTVRVAWRVNPKDEAATQAQALADEDRMVAAVQTDTRVPLCYCRILYRRSRRRLSASREWLFADVVFGVEFDRSLLATDNQ